MVRLILVTSLLAALFVAATGAPVSTRVKNDGFDPFAGPSANPNDPEVADCSNWGC